MMYLSSFCVWLRECARQIATAWHQMKNKWHVETKHVQKMALPWSSKERQRNHRLFMTTAKRAARRQMQRRPTNFPLRTFCVIAAVFKCSVFTYLAYRLDVCLVFVLQYLSTWGGRVEQSGTGPQNGRMIPRKPYAAGQVEKRKYT